MEPLKGTTTGGNVLNGFLHAAVEINLDLRKLISVMTNGAPAMVDRINGFVSLLECHFRDDGINRSLLKFHYIIHQETLCAIFLTFNEVMKVVVKAVNLILSFDLRKEISEFLDQKSLSLPGLSDQQWMAVSTDITSH